MTDEDLVDNTKMDHMKIDYVSKMRGRWILFMMVFNKGR
jgi:hypothetical protein